MSKSTKYKTTPVLVLTIALLGIILSSISLSSQHIGYFSFGVGRAYAAPDYPAVTANSTGVSGISNVQKHPITLPNVSANHTMVALFSNDGSATATAYNGMQALASMNTKRADHGCATDGTYGYAGGGIQQTGPVYLSSIERYNPATNTWTYMAPLGTGRWGIAAAYCNGNVWFFGGYEPGTYSNKVDKLNVGSNTTTSGTNLPYANRSMLAITVGNYIYLFYNDLAMGPPCYTYRFDPTGNGGLGSYTQLASSSHSHGYGGASYVEVGGEKRIYLLGGGETPGVSTDHCEYYRVDYDDYVAITSAPDGRDGQVREQWAYNGKIYYGPGEDMALGPTWYYDFYVYDTSTATWDTTAIFWCTTAKDGVAGWCIGSSLYMCGGRYNSSDEVTQLEVYTADSPRWTSEGTAAYSTTVRGSIFSRAVQTYNGMYIWTSATEQSSHIVLEIAGSSGNITCTSATGSSTNPDPPNHNMVVSNDYLIIATHTGDSNVQSSAAPSGYNNYIKRASSGTGGAVSAVATRSVTGTSENPGVFTCATEQWVSWTIAVEPAPVSAPDISNSPSSKYLGFVSENSTHYFKGVAPSNPVQSGDCYFSVTNSSGFAVDLYMATVNATGGVGWTLVSGIPGENQYRVTVYFVGDNPSSDNVVLTGIAQLVYSGLAGSSSIGWDGTWEVGTFTDGTTKQSDITISAQAS